MRPLVCNLGKVSVIQSHETPSNIFNAIQPKSSDTQYPDMNEASSGTYSAYFHSRILTECAS